MGTKKDFLNFKVDHMTFLVKPEMYGVSYALFRIILGVQQEDILYNRTKEWRPGEGERSMTFAAMVGNAPDEPKDVDKTIIAVVQPTEPRDQASHVRTMLDEHRAASHWQHIALRTPDLAAFHKHAVERAVNFVTPILKDPDDDLIQVFSGEWYFPGMPSSAVFFEFVQRNPSAAALKRLEERNREAWFQDDTFLGLYQIKEDEYQTGNVMPIIDFALFDKLASYIGKKEVFQLTDTDVDRLEEIMLDYAAERQKR